MSSAAVTNLRDAWATAEAADSERLRSLCADIMETEAAYHAAAADDDGGLVTKLHSQYLALTAVPARSISDLKWKVGALDRVAGTDTAGHWRDDIDLRLIRSIAIDVSNMSPDD